MNLLAALRQKQRADLLRLRRVMKEGSPLFHYDVGAIAAAGYEEVEINTTYPAAQKYAPLDTCLIINNDAVDIAIEFDARAEKYYIVPAGTIRRISPEEVAAFRSARIHNLDAAAAVTQDLIDIDFYRSPESIDSIARGDL